MTQTTCHHNAIIFRVSFIFNQNCMAWTSWNAKFGLEESPRFILTIRLIDQNSIRSLIILISMLMFRPTTTKAKTLILFLKFFPMIINNFPTLNSTNPKEPIPLMIMYSCRLFHNLPRYVQSIPVIIFYIVHKHLSLFWTHRIQMTWTIQILVNYEVKRRFIHCPFYLSCSLMSTLSQLEGWNHHFVVGWLENFEFFWTAYILFVVL